MGQMDSSLQADVETMDRLLLKLSLVARRRLAEVLNKYHLTIPQYIALRALQGADQGFTMTQLAEATYQVAATMTGIIDRLAERGLVQRSPDPSDRRVWRVALTPEGQTLLQEVDTHRRARIARSLEAVSGQERQFVLTLLARYLSAFEPNQNE